MNIHGKDIKIFAANSTVRVSEQIAECLGLPLGKSEVSTLRLPFLCLNLCVVLTALLFSLHVRR